MDINYKNIIGVCTLAFISTLYSQQLLALTITSEVFDSETLTEIMNASMGDSISNGDFTIERTGFDSTLGNGIDESTRWDFDFTGDPHYTDFIACSGKLVSAILTMTLTPESLISTDSFGIPSIGRGLPASDLFGTQNPPIGVPQTLSIDLISHYDGDAIKNALGPIGMSYQDDAIISYAKLELTKVPEPLSLSLIAVGLFSLYASQKRRVTNTAEIGQLPA